MNFARDRGAITVAITDSEVSPLAVGASYTLKARSDMASFVDSLVAPLSLVNALLVAVSRKKNDDLARTFQNLEQIWEEYGVYEKVQE
jgi:DNA-binding MurR/RpiR family transcriptional regulator